MNINYIIKYKYKILSIKYYKILRFKNKKIIICNVEIKDPCKAFEFQWVKIHSIKEKNYLLLQSHLTAAAAIAGGG